MDRKMQASSGSGLQITEVTPFPTASRNAVTIQNAIAVFPHQNRQSILFLKQLKTVWLLLYYVALNLNSSPNPLEHQVQQI